MKQPCNKEDDQASILVDIFGCLTEVGINIDAILMIIIILAVLELYQ